MGSKFSCSDNNSINYYYAYKRMILMNKITNDKITFNAFLVKIQSISNFIKLIEKLDNINEKTKEIINDSFKNFQLEKKIKLYYSFEECEYIIKNNLINENEFIIVDKFFFKYLNIKINDKNKKYVTINKNESIYSIEFPNSNKNLNFIEIKPRIYIFNKNNIIVKNKNKTIRLFDKIKSKNIIVNITSYIKDENYLLKLIKYSKYIQKKLDINILNYQEKFQEKFLNKRFNYEDFLIFNLERYSEKIEILYDKFKKQTLKYKINSQNINKFVVNYFNNYYNNLNNKEYSLYENSKDIDLDSPFFDVLLNTDFFNKIFNIAISIEYIYEKEYKSKLKKINESNIEISSLTFYIEYEEDFDLNLIKDLNINFSQLKKLIIKKNRYLEINFKELINLFNIQNNLIYFQYESGDYYHSHKIDLNLIEIINNFKSLKYLILSGVKISSLFELKLNNLKHLELIGCSNFTFNNNNFNLNYLKLIGCSSIVFSDNNFLSLKYLELGRGLVVKSSISMLKCPELNELILKDRNKFSDLDFKNLMKLKKFEGNINYFLLLEPSKLLESLIISFYDNDFTSIEEKEEKVMKSLKTKQKFYSVKKLKINLYQSLNLNDLINFFPNLLDLNVEYWEKYPLLSCGARAEIGPKNIIIEENENSKINNIKLSLYAANYITIELNCIPYNILKSFDLYTDYIEIDNFPFFKSKCNIIFNCLESFHFSLNDRDGWLSEEKKIKKEKEKLIENLYKNIDKMPNLTDFYFNFNCENINENFYIKFIEKVLTLKSLKKIFININNSINEYLELDLKQLFPEKDFNKYEKVEIYKLYKFKKKIFNY